MAEPPLSFKLDEQIHFLQVSRGSPFTLLKEKKKKKTTGPRSEQIWDYTWFSNSILGLL